MSAASQAMAVGDENSLEPILFSEVYPKKETHLDEKGLTAPFTVLYGESIEYLGRTSDGIIALSNYRVHVMLKESFINIPIGVIETVEYRDIFFMHVFCKDARTFRCAFATNDMCLEWCKRLNRSIRAQNRLIDAFSFSFHAWLTEAERNNQLVDGYYCLAKLDEPQSSVFDREVQRLGFDLKSAWRITHANSEFKVCSSYPKQHIVPYNVTDKDIETVAEFRSSRRFPSIVWRDAQSGVVLARSSQPTLGWLGWRSPQDEALLKAIADSCNPISGYSDGDTGNVESAMMTASTNNGCGPMNGNGGGVITNGSPHANGKVANESCGKLVIIDARSYTAAFANRAKGGGCECPEYYTNCEIMFMNLANIHTVRKSFLALRTICAMSPDQPGWLINLENTKWLQYISGLLKSATIVVNTIDKDRKPVLVHCSDGWDRTPQIVALAELMLDPFYRTMEGFRILVEKEWIEFGHKFSDRCGQGVASEDVSERCPVFLQWLDCVHQLVRQFPCAFQFNETYLVKLVQHVYSCLFGDFLCNTEMERTKERVRQKTSSVWLLLSRHNVKFVNLLYRPSTDRILRPLYHMQNLHFWNEVYLSDTATVALADGQVPASVTNGDMQYASGSDVSSSSAATSPDQQVALPAKTRSCDDLTKAVLDEDDVVHPISSGQRRLSDSNLAAHIVTSPTSDDKIPSVNSSEDDNISAATPEEMCADMFSALGSDEAETLLDLGTKKCVSSETLKAPEDFDIDLPAWSNVACGTETSDIDERSTVPAVCIGFSDSENSEHIAQKVLRVQDHGVFETSSDTLTGDDGHVVGADPELPVNGEGDFPQDSGRCPAASCGQSASQINHLLACDHMTSRRRNTGSNMRMTDRCSSTSDLSSSHVVIGVGTSFAVDSKRHYQSAVPLSVDTTVSMFATSVKNGNGVLAAADVDGSSRTPSRGSTSPPTPSGDLKSAIWNVRLTKPSHSLDWDGLTFYVDPVQQRIAQIVSEHEQQIHHLERQLSTTRAMLNKCAANMGQLNMDSKDEQSSNDSGERGSTGAVSAGASDVSWEQVEEKDSKVTLWVPDHVVTHCAGCQQEFWMVRRKHHCRNCGHIFCGECSDYLVPVPQQQLEKPVRVCYQCYHQSLSASVSSDISATQLTNPSRLKTVLGLSV